MNTKDQNYISMARSCDSVFTKWENEWTSIPKLNEEVGAMRDEVAKIDVTASQTLLKTEGITEGKLNAKDETLSAVVNIAKPAAVYVQDIGNMELHRQLNQSKGVLAGFSQNDLFNKLTAMYNILEEIKGEVTEYGVTEERLADAKAKLDAFGQAVPSTRDAIVARKTNNEIIAESITNLRRIFYRLDNLMKLFDATPFYAEYKNARIVVDLGSRKRSRDESDGNAETDVAESDSRM